MSIQFRGKAIPITLAPTCSVDDAINSNLIHDWLATLDQSIEVRSISIQSVDRFPTGRIGFVKIKADTYRNGIRIPGICMLRGSAVAILVVIEDEATHEQWTILESQPRVGTGKMILEIPAGMTDGVNDMRSVAVNEMKEECGLVINPDELIDITELAYEEKYNGIYTSGGLFDEFIHIYLWKTTMTSEKISELNGRIGGEDDHEQIVLELYKLDDVWKTAPDAKTLSALSLYEELKERGKL